MACRRTIDKKFFLSTILFVTLDISDRTALWVALLIKYQIFKKLMAQILHQLVWK